MKLILSLDKSRLRKLSKLEKRQPLRVSLDFHGVRTQVYTNSTYLADHLRLGYRYFESNHEDRPHLDLLALEAGQPRFQESVGYLIPDRAVRDHLLVARNLGLIFVLRDPPLLAYYTVKALFSQALFLLRRRFLGLHAATLAYDGRGLILCGAARCGKTILTTLLMDLDLSYSSDDVTLLTKRSLKVVPFPRALTIREEYRELLGPILSMARKVQRFRIADQDRLLVDLIHRVPGEVEPSVVCLPRYEPSKSTRLIPASPSTAFIALIRNRFHPLVGTLDEYESEDFEILSRLVDRVSCFRLDYSDPVEAASALKDLMSAGDSGK
jgi:hypothetical protein